MEVGTLGRLFKSRKEHGMQPELHLLSPNSFLAPMIHLQAPKDLPPEHIPISHLHSSAPIVILV